MGKGVEDLLDFGPDAFIAALFDEGRGGVPAWRSCQRDYFLWAFFLITCDGFLPAAPAARIFPLESAEKH